MKPLDEVYTLDADRLQALRSGGRARSSDPVTENEFAEGDRVVFCGECMRPHLLSSWQGYANRCACWRGAQTVSRFRPFEPDAPYVAPPRKRGWVLWTTLTGAALAAIVAVVAAVNRDATRTAPPVVVDTPAPTPPMLQKRPFAAVTVRPRTTPHARHARAPASVAARTAPDQPSPAAAPGPRTPPPQRVAAPPPQRTAAALARPHQIARLSTVVRPKEPVTPAKTVAVAAATPAEDTGVPCATVDFRVSQASRNDRGTVYEKVYADVTFADGHHERATFPYEWAYPNNGAANPWSSENLKNDMEVTLQTPPPDADVAAYPALIQYLLKHTGSDGRTDLRTCPPGTKR